MLAAGQEPTPAAAPPASDPFEPYDWAHFRDASPSHTSIPTSQSSPDAPVESAKPTSTSTTDTPSVPSTASATAAPRPRNAITSSVFTADYAGMALMLGWSLAGNNNLTALDAELVLLTLHDDTGKDGITTANRTRLEKAGWRIREAQALAFAGVNQTQIRSRHRHNLNKLHMWSWTEYERVVFVDADAVCKGSIAELLQMPGGEYAPVCGSTHTRWCPSECP